MTKNVMILFSSLVLIAICALMLAPQRAIAKAAPVAPKQVAFDGGGGAPIPPCIPRVNCQVN